MNKKINVTIAGMSLLAFTFALGRPLSAESTSTSVQTNKTRVTQATEEETTESTGEESTSLKQRLQERKEKLNIQLSAAQKARLQNRCKNSQGKLSSLEGRIKGIETSRAQVYEHLVDRLTKLSDKLKTKGLDTTELDAHIETLKGKIETFETDLANYKQAVADLAAMDCAEDPDAFKASLEEARTLKATLRESGQDIKEFVKGEIKTTLKAIRKQIAASTPDTSDDTEEGETEGGEGSAEGTENNDNEGGE